MAIDDLVQTIVREVLKQLQEGTERQQILILARQDDVAVAPVLLPNYSPIARTNHI